MARKNAVGTVRFTVSVDPTTDHVLQRMVPLGLHGKNRAEVASWILREWIWHNKQDLAAVGVSVRPDDGPADARSSGSPDRDSRGSAGALGRIPGKI